ncbi:Kynureninase (L-kynurenine hydrolase) [Dispira parvispora]|uniref:Kynureninase n=1 Tax=Dispira parvispora TaxID=1520584 RepID=A0A9W8E718_9FUNG|nr:Kynureninase (L-kynurenine hydrolase) [Dispira parvispora]
MSLDQLAQQANLDIGDPQFAQWLDCHDPLSSLRDEFTIPLAGNIRGMAPPDVQVLPVPQRVPDDQPCIYLCGNSLGLQPKITRKLVSEELDTWGQRGVVGHTSHPYERPWITIDEPALDEMAKIVGARQGEVSVLNSLTVNIHFLFAAFYRPTSQRYKVLIEAKAFPSDRYALRSQIRWHGLNPDDALIELAPRAGEHCLRTEDILRVIDEQGDSIAVVFFSGIQFYTGQLFDIPSITQAGQRRGCLVGFDLAHAVGNVPLQLHDWGVDFACWCSYKYLNSGPGGIAGIYVHQRYTAMQEKQRLAGWWSNRVDTRFQMQDQLDPIPDTPGYQVSNPSVLSMVSLLGGLKVFSRTSMSALREKSLRLTGYLEYLLTHHPELAQVVTIITPTDPQARGCQLSLILPDIYFQPVFQSLKDAGVVCDEREPNCIRVAPIPLYNTFADVHRFVDILGEIVSKLDK